MGSGLWAELSKPVGPFRASSFDACGSSAHRARTPPHRWLKRQFDAPYLPHLLIVVCGGDLNSGQKHSDHLLGSCYLLARKWGPPVVMSPKAQAQTVRAERQDHGAMTPCLRTTCQGSTAGAQMCRESRRWQWSRARDAAFAVGF